MRILCIILTSRQSSIVQMTTLSSVPVDVLRTCVIAPHLVVADVKRLAMCGTVGRRACDDAVRYEMYCRHVRTVRRDLDHYVHTLVILTADTLSYFGVGVTLRRGMTTYAWSGDDDEYEGAAAALSPPDRPMSVTELNAAVQRLDDMVSKEDDDAAATTLTLIHRDHTTDPYQSTLTDVLSHIDATRLGGDDAAIALARYIRHTGEKGATIRLRVAYVCGVVEGSYEDGEYHLVGQLCRGDWTLMSTFIRAVERVQDVGEARAFVDDFCLRCALPPLGWIDDMVRRVSLLPPNDVYLPPRTYHEWKQCMA